MYVVSIKEYNNSKAGLLITLLYFIKNSPISIYNLVSYWSGNKILSRVDSIQSVINLHIIPIQVHRLYLQFNSTTLFTHSNMDIIPHFTEFLQSISPASTEGG